MTDPQPTDPQPTDQHPSEQHPSEQQPPEPQPLAPQPVRPQPTSARSPQDDASLPDADAARAALQAVRDEVAKAAPQVYSRWIWLAVTLAVTFVVAAAALRRRRTKAS